MPDVLVGLKNEQNNCYINAVIHCLRACDFGQVLNLKYDFIGDWFQCMVDLLTKSSACSQDLEKYMNGFFEHNMKTNKQFLLNVQADAQEFLLNLLFNIQQKTTNDFRQTFVLSIEDNIEKSCRKHNTIVPHNDYMLNLKIDELKIKDRISVENLIQKYFETEDIDCECEICKTTRAKKSKTLTATPTNMMVVLNIFKFHQNVCSKISRYIDLTSELNMRDYYRADGATNIQKYKLKSVCFHQGQTINSGHYTSNNNVLSIAKKILSFS